MGKAESLLIKATPKLVLDHYWEIFDLIAWRLDIELLHGREYFTYEDIAIYLSDRSSSDSPILQRSYLRSKAILDILLNKLIDSGLLLRQNGRIHRTEDCLELHTLLNRIKTSVRMLVAWAVLYIYGKGVTSFTTEELLGELSYSDEEYRDEMQYLHVRSDETWSNLLRKSQDKWCLVEQPYHLTNPILLLDIRNRITKTIFELSKKEFSEQEVVVKLRKLEAKSLESHLMKFRSRQENGKWNIDEDSLNSIRQMISVKDFSIRWPFFGVLKSRGSIFKLLGSQSHTLYVDMPNWSFSSFLEQLQSICHENAHDQDKMLMLVHQATEDFNEAFKHDLGNWLSFGIRKPFFMDRPFGVQALIRWGTFLSFLEEFSQKNIPLEEKYEYILNCRAPSLELVMRGDLERTQSSVKEIAKDDLERIHQFLEELAAFLEGTKDRLYRMAHQRKKIPSNPSVLQYLPEMISTLRAATSLIDNGTIPAVYREMRKILESLAWMIFDDSLFFNTTAIKSRTEYEVPRSPYALVSRKWYVWSIQNKLTLRHLGELKNNMKDLVSIIQNYGVENGLDWDKTIIENAIFSNLSTSMFLLLVGKDVEVPDGLAPFVPEYETGLLTTLAKDDLMQMMKTIRQGSFSFSDKEIMARVGAFFQKRTPEKVMAPYPSNEFVLRFVDKVFNSDLTKKYDEYSHFVHSYFTSWHIFPFSSVLEFKVFRNELEVISKMLHNLISNYIEQLFIPNRKRKTGTL